jgi:hypothetical protein
MLRPSAVLHAGGLEVAGGPNQEGRKEDRQRRQQKDARFLSYFHAAAAAAADDRHAGLVALSGEAWYGTILEGHAGGRDVEQ